MQVSLWLLFLDVFLWTAIFIVHAVRVTTTTLSSFELKRRTESGDQDAIRISEREQLVPRLRTLRRIVEVVLLVLATALTIASFGWIIGVLLASLLSLLLDTISRVRVVERTTRALYTPRETSLLAHIRSWTWLDWFRGVTEVGDDLAATSRAELHYIVERSAAVLSRDELLRLQASLAFDTHTVEDIMTPISVVDLANVNDSLGPLVLDDLHKTGHSRFPVIDRDVHHVVGILYLHDIINLKSAKPSVREAMDPRVHYIHEHQTLEHALNGFLKSHRHLFIVVNDYRETVGVLALEDVLETLLGKKIVDEFDQYEDLRAVAESNPRKNNLPKGKTDI